MLFLFAALLIDTFALIGIYFSSANTTPLYGKPPYRLFGIFVMKHLLITFVSGAIIGVISDVRPICLATFYGTVFQFVLGQIIHIMFSTKTMLLYKLGLGMQPDGTGRLAAAIMKKKDS